MSASARPPTQVDAHVRQGQRDEHVGADLADLVLEIVDLERRMSRRARQRLAELGASAACRRVFTSR